MLQDFEVCLLSHSVLSVDVGRPIKLSFSPALVAEMMGTFESISRVTSRGGDEKKHFSRRDNQLVEASEKGDSATHTELKLVTSQVLVELKLCSAAVKKDESSFSLELEASLQGEMDAFSYSGITKEGILLAWDGFSGTYPHDNNHS